MAVELGRGSCLCLLFLKTKFTASTFTGFPKSALATGCHRGIVLSALTPEISLLTSHGFESSEVRLPTIRKVGVRRQGRTMSVQSDIKWIAQHPRGEGNKPVSGRGNSVGGWGRWVLGIGHSKELEIFPGGSGWGGAGKV